MQETISVSLQVKKSSREAINYTKWKSYKLHPFVWMPVVELEACVGLINMGDELPICLTHKGSYHIMANPSEDC